LNFHRSLSTRNTGPKKLVSTDGKNFEVWLLALLFPATRHDPSKARVTDRIGTSPAGVCTGQESQQFGGGIDSHQFMGAKILTQFPLLNTSTLVT